MLALPKEEEWTILHSRGDVKVIEPVFKSQAYPIARDTGESPMLPSCAMEACEFILFSNSQS